MASPKNSRPKRPRSHEIEDKSKAILALILPDSWLIRFKESNDYGIDGEIEFFDDNKEATGTIIPFQLKGSEKIDETKPKVVLKVTTINYHKDLTSPVLIFLVDTITQKIYYKWSHEIDTHYIRRKAKTYTVKMDPGHCWNKSTTAKLLEDLAIYFRVYFSQIKTPISFKIQGCLKNVKNFSSYKLESKLNYEFRNLQDLIHISREPGEICEGEVKIFDQAFRITLGGYGGAVMDFDSNYYKKEGYENVAKDISNFIFIAFLSVGQNNIAIKILRKIDLRDSIKNNPQIIAKIFDTLLEEGETEDALKFYKEHSFHPKEGVNIENSLFFSVSLMKNKNKLDQLFLNGYIDFQKQIIQKFIADKKLKDAGILAYNLGNFLRSVDRSFEAFQYYKKAITLNKNYSKQSYFFKELGSLLFSSARYRASAKYYSQAIELGGDNLCTPYYADALFFTGKYKKALTIISEFLLEKEKFDPSFKALQILADLVIDGSNLQKQTRKTSKLTHLNLEDFDKLKKKNKERILEERISLDALDPLAWSLSGEIYAKEKNFEQASYCFFVSANITRTNPGEWCNAIFCIIQSPKAWGLLEVTIAAAFRNLGIHFKDHLIDYFSDKIPQKTDDIIGAIDLVLASTNWKWPDEKTIRFLGKDGEPKTFSLHRVD